MVKNFLWQQVLFVDIQYNSMPRRSTTDAIFIVRQWQEKFHAININKTLYMVFVDLGRALDRVPRFVIWWALRRIGLGEWLTWLIQSICENVRSRECVACNLSESSVWKWVFSRALAWDTYCSSWFWKPSFKSSVGRVSRKSCMQMPWSPSMDPCVCCL